MYSSTACCTIVCTSTGSLMMFVSSSVLPVDSSRVDLFRDLVLDLLANIAEIFQRHTLLNLFRQRGRLDPEGQQAFRIGRLGTEIGNIEFVQTHRVDGQIVLPRSYNRA